jgi:flagellar hook protein FlgE
MGVNGAMYIGVSGLSTFATAIEAVSDNVANVGTNGFKSSSPLFADMVSGYYSTTSSSIQREGSGSGVLSVASDFSEGTIKNTGTWSDVAINGAGFFNVVNSTGQTFYTRDGSFNVDKNGYLVNPRGFQVLDTSGAPLQIEADPTTPAYASYHVDASGQVWGNPVGGGAPVTIGAPIMISTFANPNGLIRQGDNLLLQGPDAGAHVDGAASSGPRGSLIAFAVEGSNVDLASQMVDMIVYQANYNANSKSITTASNMLDTVLNIIR